MAVTVVGGVCVLVCLSKQDDDDGRGGGKKKYERKKGERKTSKTRPCPVESFALSR